MAPLETSAVSRSNARPLAFLAGHALLVASLTGHILYTIWRAAKSLPPSTATRSQQSVRRRNAAIFSGLALLSLASVTTFGIAWRLFSYFEWAEKGKYEAPGSLWNGWYGTGDEGVGQWRLGDWWSDVNLIEESDAAVMSAPEAFWHVNQHFCGIAAASILYGIEGRRRNLPLSVIASFVALSVFGSLGLALNLFLVTLLYTPQSLHDDSSPRDDTLFTPKPAVLYLPVVGAILSQSYFPTLIAERKDLNLFRAAYLTIPLFLAFAPKIIPERWGRHHLTKASAHHSFVRAFYVLGIASFLLYWQDFIMALAVNTPPERRYDYAYDLFLNAIGKEQHKPNRLVQALGNTARTLKRISSHPAITVTGNDIVLTAIGLLTWTFLKNLDVGDLLENSLLSFLGPSKTDKHVAFAEKVEETMPEVEEEVIVPVTPKKRPGRPKKSSVEPVTPSPSTTAVSRRSTRRNPSKSLEAEGEEAYQPAAHDRHVFEQTESDGASYGEDLVGAGESTALALLLAFTGGLGQLAASVLGAEVTGNP